MKSLRGKYSIRENEKVVALICDIAFWNKKGLYFACDKFLKIK